MINHGPLKFGVISGTQCVPIGDLDALAAISRRMDVDILISGGTHRFEAYEYDGRFYVNPGSATGAWSSLWKGQAIPSFALMDVQASVVVTYVYQLIDGEVKVDKVEYRKPDGNQPSSSYSSGKPQGHLSGSGRDHAQQQQQQQQQRGSTNAATATAGTTSSSSQQQQQASTSEGVSGLTAATGSLSVGASTGSPGADAASPGNAVESKAGA